jgi:hypothetical protein
MCYDLQSLIQPVDNLESLVEPFSHEEVDNVIQNLKTGKSLGFDGFDTDFMKKCWELIKRDFMNCAWHSIIKIFV